MRLEQISIKSQGENLRNNENDNERERKEMLRMYFEHKPELKNAIRQALVYTKGGSGYRSDSKTFKELIIKQVLSEDYLEKKLRNNVNMFGFWLGEKGKLNELIEEVENENGENEVFTDKEKKSLIEDAAKYGITDPEGDEDN